MRQINPADEFRDFLIRFVRQFEAALSETQESRITLFLFGREVEMRLSGVTSTNFGFLLLRGRDKEGNPIEVGLDHRDLAYALHAVEASKPVRFGF